MALVELVRTVTRDGLRLDGALIPTRRASEGLSAAILLHGVGSNFYTSSTFEPLVEKLVETGLAVLRVNSRGHDAVFEASPGNVRRRFGAAYEIVDECRHDIVAWVEFLISRGHTKIALIGHSLGAVKAIYAQAHEKLAAISSVIAVSPPRLSYEVFVNAGESARFLESFLTAERLAKEGRGDELFTSQFPFPLLITANAYLDKYGKAERYNFLRFAGELSCPNLFVYGTKELQHGGSAFAGVTDALADLPNSSQRKVAVIPGADHFYTGVSGILANEIMQWLAPLSAP